MVSKGHRAYFAISSFCGGNLGMCNFYNTLLIAHVKLVHLLHVHITEEWDFCLFCFLFLNIPGTAQGLFMNHSM